MLEMASGGGDAALMNQGGRRVGQDFGEMVTYQARDKTEVAAIAQAGGASRMLRPTAVG